MNLPKIPVLYQLAYLIEEIFTSHQPAVEAATAVAVEVAEQDPKVQAVTAASLALLTAAKNLKAATSQQPPVPPANG